MRTKYSFLFFIAVFLQNSIASENKNSELTASRFPIKATSEWLVYYEEMDYDTSHMEGDEIIRFFINGDTTIFDKSYFKLYKSVTAYYDVVTVLDNIYVGAIRDEADKFYLIEKDKTSEIYLYNFDLQAFERIHSSIDQEMVVTTIQTLPDGRRKYNYKKTDFQHGKCLNQNNSFFIEGIGSMGGLLYVAPCNHVGFREHYLVCYSEDGRVVYQSSLSTRKCNSSKYPINPHAIWSIVILNGDNQDQVDEKYKYFIEGDTLINSVLYYKLYKSGVAYYDEPFYFNKLYVGAIRDNDNKFFFVEKSQTAVKTLFDYNLGLNDTVKSQIGKDRIINSLEYLPDGRKKIASLPEICAGCCPAPVFLEGIGHSDGLLEEPSCNHPGYQTFILSCYYEGSKKIYENLNYSARFCESTLSVPDFSASKSGLKIFPVPAKYEVNVEIQDRGIVPEYLEIYDLSGKLVYHNLIKKNTFNFEIKVSNFSSGIYFIKIRNKNSIIAGKFIVE